MPTKEEQRDALAQAMLANNNTTPPPVQQLVKPGLPIAPAPDAPTQGTEPPPDAPTQDPVPTPDAPDLASLAPQQNMGFSPPAPPVGLPPRQNMGYLPPSQPAGLPPQQRMGFLPPERPGLGPQQPMGYYASPTNYLSQSVTDAGMTNPYNTNYGDYENYVPSQQPLPQTPKYAPLPQRGAGLG
jgi:hypothetical protein